MRNGLYSIHMALLDGRAGKGSGVVVFRDGTIRGGDAYLYYIGSYEPTPGGFRGQVQVMQHTPSPQASPVFGNQASPVGVGVTGMSDGDRATISGTALVGKASQIFTASLLYLADAG